ncbi:MAG: NAD-dependent epimerase/dehydratase family protein [Proteobacteria bacterium]|nr:NAD-dependent epimerase/dehydratase family protein [Pseudomonadota bacterium]
MILITGGAKFIGSNFVHQWLAAQNEPVVNLDSLRGDGRYFFDRDDIDDAVLAAQFLRARRPCAVLNMSGEQGSHEVGMRPAVVAAGRRQRLNSNRDAATEAAT